jgi:DNA-binding NarL/FixJ family response regulator
VLGIAEGTVKSHMVRLYEVLDVTNRTEAAMRMRELGLDEPI